MAYCQNCRFFKPVPEDADDYEPDKGGCVREEVDHNGKYWLSKPVMGKDIADYCSYFIPRFIVET